MTLGAPARRLVQQSPRLLNGAETMGLACWLAGARIACIFPITPQSEVIDYFSAHPDIRCIEADSEYNVLAAAQGVLWGGERCAVATASQGLVLMSEVMWEVAGNRLPMVLGIFSRGLKGPGWCLGTQQNDALFFRDTGWLQLYASTLQEIMDFTLIAYRLAETVKLPVMVVGDGFYLSHELAEVMVPEPGAALQFVGIRDLAGLPFHSPPASYGALVPPESYSRFYQTLYQDMERSTGVFIDVAQEFERVFDRGYQPVAGYRLEGAETVIFTAGTISGTAQQVVDDLRERGQPVGLLKLNLFRPFPAGHCAAALSRASRILVLDRNIDPGCGGIFASHLRDAFHSRRLSIPVFGAVTGLGGLDVTPAMVENAIKYVQSAAPTSRPLFLHEQGIE